MRRRKENGPRVHPETVPLPMLLRDLPTLASSTDAPERGPLSVRGVDALATLTEYRSAARSISRDEGLGGRRCVGLAALADQARAELAGDPWVLSAVQQVILAEAREYLDDGRTPAAPGPSWRDPGLMRLRALATAGAERCCHCHRAIPSAELIAQWEDRQHAGWLELLARETALERERLRRAAQEPIE